MKPGQRMQRPHFLWITDPWTTLDHPRDTTLRLMEESLKMGIASSWCDVRSIRFENGRVRLDVLPVLRVHPNRNPQGFNLAPSEKRSPEEFTHLFYRVDPPVDEAYIAPLQLLKLGLRSSLTRSQILNAPEVLLETSEKIEPFRLGNLAPESLVSSEPERLLGFLRKQKKAVLKPLHTAQSRGVRVLQSTDLKLATAAIQTATESGRIPVLLQRFLPGITKGEVRLWFSRGRLVARARKIPRAGSAIIDMDRGGSVVATELTLKERSTARKISSFLKKRKVLWAAVDLIDGKITDFNLTSPGLIVQLETVLERNLARILVEDALED